MKVANTFSHYKTALIGLGVVLVIGLILVSSYNNFVSLSVKVDTQWAQVENQYQRRFDLIPNLVATVKGITKQELDVFGQIAEARKGYSGAATTGEKVAAANQVESALGRLLVITENYPELKSNVQFSALMAEIAGTENRVAVERGRFNDVVSAYNVKVKTFPGTLTASLFGFQEKDLFKASVEAAAPPKIDFSK